MRHAYLIAAHENRDQLRRLLLRVLSESDQDFVVLHLDLESELWRSYRRELESVSERVHLVESPTHVRWGHHSIVEAQYKLLAHACRVGFDIAHHISGADWPIATRAARESELAGFETLPAFARIFGEEQVPRMQKFWWPNPEPSSWRQHPIGRRCWNIHERWLHGLANRLVAKAGGARRRTFGIEWQKGSGWWSLPSDIAHVVRDDLAMILHSGRLRLTTCADEHVVPTILVRSFADRIEDYRRFIRWSPGAWSPDLLRHSDADAILASGAWFARKFDMRQDDWFLRLGE